MKTETIYLDDLSWIEDPSDMIDKLEQEYDENKKNKRKTKYQVSLENGDVMEVDFENDPDWPFLWNIKMNCLIPMEISFLTRK